MITPVQGRLLVKLKGQYEHLDTTEERFGTSKTRGEVLAIAANINKDCKDLGIKVGKTIYFGKYEDTAPYGSDSNLILIKLEEIGGVSDGEDE